MKTSLFAALLPVLLVSCGVLKPVEDTSINHLLDPAVPERSLTGSSPAIAVSRPSLPSYLDRQQLVSRTTTGELQMNSYHLWAEPLDASISRVTAANLARLTNSLNIQPVENFVTLDYQSLLEIRVSRFEPDATGEVVLDLRGNCNRWWAGSRLPALSARGSPLPGPPSSPVLKPTGSTR